MTENLLNISHEIKTVFKEYRVTFETKSGQNKWIYALRVYSLYIVVAALLLGRLHGLLAAYAMLFFGSAMFIAVSFYVTKELQNIAQPRNPEHVAAKNTVFYSGVVFLPPIIALSGVEGDAAVLFGITFLTTIVYAIGVKYKTKLAGIFKEKS